MNEESKYYNLDSVPAGWTKEEFRRAVLALEPLDHKTLEELITRLGIQYPQNRIQDLNHEELVDVLFRDVARAELLAAIEERSKEAGLLPGHGA